MVKINKLFDKEGEALMTTGDKPEQLLEYSLEVGDEFIPLYNTVKKETNKRIVNGEEKDITDYSLKVNLRDKDKNLHEGIFLKLTPTQGESLISRSVGFTDNGGKDHEAIFLNQTMFQCYPYEATHKDLVSNEMVTKEYVAIGLKIAFAPAKSFEDFDEE